ncbi:MAG: fold, partial [Thermoplasmata archaeon]|nr:fold [Thermoplasmata archaeon]
MGDASGLAQFFDRCPVPAAIVGFDGVVQDANPALLEMTKWRRDEVVGHALQEFLNAGDLVPSVSDAAAIERGSLAGAWEARMAFRDGLQCWLNWDVAASHGERRYFCVARQLPAEEVRRQERFKLDFINMAAHEL